MMNKTTFTDRDIVNKLKSLNYKYKMVIFTDRVEFLDELLCADDLLELRAFDSSGEFRAYRDVIGKEFKVREINDDSAYDGFFDQAQYLDIDKKETKARNDSLNQGEVITTGGGRIRLPEDAKGNELILVRFYFNYNENGIAEKTDWRLVGFVNNEVIGNE